jgi:ATP-dependent Zn protease
MKKKSSIVKNVSDFLRSKSATTETCQKIIDKCNKWIEGNKQREIEKIDKQISELQKIKESLL